MKVTIWHNPRCSKSRQTLGILKDQGIEPDIVEYLNNTPDEETIKRVLDLLGRSPRELMRKGEEEYKALGLKNDQLSDEELIIAMANHPRLIERPVVLANGKAAVGRPPESVLEIL